MGELQKIVAIRYSLTLNASVLTPEEVAISRFGGLEAWGLPRQ
ncbi:MULTISPECIES: hypothetical protein [Corallococcus]|nr:MULTISPECIES: hypothetical protein [Corallococcus]